MYCWAENAYGSMEPYVWLPFIVYIVHFWGLLRMREHGKVFIETKTNFGRKIISWKLQLCRYSVFSARPRRDLRDRICSEDTWFGGDLIFNFVQTVPFDVSKHNVCRYSPFQVATKFITNSNCLYPDSRSGPNELEFDLSIYIFSLAMAMPVCSRSGACSCLFAFNFFRLFVWAIYCCCAIFDQNNSPAMFQSMLNESEFIFIVDFTKSRAILGNELEKLFIHKWPGLEMEMKTNTISISFRLANEFLNEKAIDNRLRAERKWQREEARNCFSFRMWKKLRMRCEIASQKLIIFDLYCRSSVREKDDDKKGHAYSLGIVWWRVWRRTIEGGAQRGRRDETRRTNI